MENINIKTKQKEVLDSTRKLWKDTYAYVVETKSPEWIKTYWRDLFQSVSSKSREMTKIYKRKRMDDDVKLIQLLDLKVKIVNEINETNKKEVPDTTTFGEFFDRYIARNKLYDENILEFTVSHQYADKLIELFRVHSDIDTNDYNVFYTENQMDKVYFYINRKNCWLESYVINTLNTLYINEELEWGK